MRSALLPFLAIFLLGAAVACGEVTNPGDDDDDDDMVADASPDALIDAGGRPDAADVNGVDLLFMIDNSGSMEEEQRALAVAFPELVAALTDANGGVLPSLHIGIVSSDVGAGPFGISGCDGNGDNGLMQNTPRLAGCAGPADAFVIDELEPDGSRSVNYNGTLEETFSCIAHLGIAGCGFEQPLESLRRALDGTNAANAGFLRDDSLLAVIILTDEDDCSTADTNMFDTSQTSLDDPLGPLSSFRCFEFGVVCEPDDPREVGEKSGCVPREDSQYMFPVAEYVNFFHETHPGRVFVATIAGPAEPVEVASTPEGAARELVAACVSSSGEAAPGVRIEGFTNGFPGASYTESVCGGIGDALIAIAQAIGDRL